jgi:3'-phosphoadenosine 5'-phosphosulfate sulfotransferase (PAPS reductase)/FAD synthetase
MKLPDHHILSFSGGKDSTATLLYLLKEKGLHPHVLFCDTGNETPETYQYVDYISRLIERWGYPPIIRLKGEDDFYSLAKKKQRFPSIKARFCTEWLKIVPFLRWLEEQAFSDDCVIVTGIRKTESKARSKRQEFEESKIYGRPQWNPIVAWSIAEVFAIHEKYGVDINPMYKKGVKRVGCFPCCNAGRLELILLAKHYPERVKEIGQWEHEMGRTYFAPRCYTKSNEPVVWGIEKHVAWAKRELNGQQSLPMDMSVCAYAELGLCE